MRFKSRDSSLPGFADGMIREFGAMRIAEIN
jgi:hypothetical protein